MTTIAALYTPGKGVTFGSDTQLTGGNRRHDISSPSGKWIVSKNGDWAVGFSGSLRSANIIEHEADMLFTNLETPFDFAQRLQALLNEYSFSLKPTGPDDEVGTRHPTFDCALLLVSPDGIWEVDFDFAVVHHPEFATSGSGGAYAAGALVACKLKKPSDRIATAIAAACHIDPYSGGNVVVGELKKR